MLVYVHVMSAILLVGYSLFWALMTAAAHRRFQGVPAARLLDTLYAAHWPPLGLPPRWRIALPNVVWIFLGGLVVSGLWLLAVRGITLHHVWQGSLLESRFGQVLTVKLLLVAVFVINSLLLLVGRVRGFVHVNLLVAVAIALASTFMMH